MDIDDVRELLEKGDSDYDAVLLHVDNGPEGLAHSDNNRLYSLDGTSCIYNSLTPGGMLAVWPDSLYVHRLQKVGFDVEVKTVRERPGKGAQYRIFLAKKTSV